MQIKKQHLVCLIQEPWQVKGFSLVRWGRPVLSQTQVKIASFYLGPGSEAEIPGKCSSPLSNALKRKS